MQVLIAETNGHKKRQTSQANDESSKATPAMRGMRSGRLESRYDTWRGYLQQLWPCRRRKCSGPRCRVDTTRPWRRSLRVGAPMTYTLADRGLNTTIDVRDLNTGAASRHGISSQSRREWRRRRIIDERSKTRRVESVTSSKPTNSFETVHNSRLPCKKSRPIVPPSF